MNGPKPVVKCSHSLAALFSYSVLLAVDHGSLSRLHLDLKGTEKQNSQDTVSGLSCLGSQIFTECILKIPRCYNLVDSSSILPGPTASSYVKYKE